MIILVVFVLDIVVDAGDLLYVNSVFEGRPFFPSVPKYLLKRNHDLAEGFVRSVFDLVPMEGLQILFSRP